MNLSLKRITSSGNFIPQIDGLRFIAILSVVLLHLNNFISVKDANLYTDNTNYAFLNNLLSHGYLGVPLFFIISGLVLGIPFAKFYIKKENPVSLKKYFLRRLSRLEPPYFIVMTLLLLATVYFAKTMTIADGFASYLASVFYIHNFVFINSIPRINTVTWSLEIEVQFYILMPLLAYLFYTKSVLFRRLFLIISIIVFLGITYFNTLPFLSLINFAHYFLIGLLLADLYVSNSKIIKETKFDTLITLLLFIPIWIFDTNDFTTEFQKFLWELIQLTCIFLFYYYVLFHNTFRFLSLKFFTNIGGMCYSIYLLHYPIISLFGNPILKYSFSNYSFINVSIYAMALLLLIFLVSAIFFLLIEKPCMQKNWHKKSIQNLNAFINFK